MDMPKSPYSSRKWKITKFVLWFTYLVCTSILLYAGYLGAKAFVELVPTVLLAMGTVTSVAVGAYNYSNMKSKEWER